MTQYTLIFLELDDVVADVSARMQLSEQRANEMVAARGGMTQRQWNDIKWETFFSPEHIILDRYITASREALEALEAQVSAEILFLTSRKEQCRLATLSWLRQYDLYLPEAQRHQARRLVMKPLAASENAQKSALWKASAIAMIASSEQASRVIVVEPLAHIRDEIERYYTPYPIDVFASLAEALSILEAEHKDTQEGGHV